MANTSAKLLRAKIAKNDEFYTQYEDIKSECDHYRSHFFNKRIYCNCDTGDSAFVKYFTELKAQGGIRDIFYSGGLGGDDFRSPASVWKLKQADIVITNPPFSLFGEFMDLLLASGKPFLIIGNKNALIRKSIFELFKQNKIWAGVRKWAGGMRFNVPDSKDTKEVPAIWITNLQHGFRPQPLNLTKVYDAALYPKYDNADAININRTADIPTDYCGVMGVPISFLEKYCPEQFEILGQDKDFTTDATACSVDGRRVYSRIFIRKILASNV